MEEARVEVHVDYEGWNELRRFASLAKERRFAHLLRTVRCTRRYSHTDRHSVRVIIVVDENNDNNMSLTEIANLLHYS